MEIVKIEMNLKAVNKEVAVFNCEKQSFRRYSFIRNGRGNSHSRRWLCIRQVRLSSLRCRGNFNAVREGE